jgi:membrane fusion protein, multidrug efflux system
MIGAQILLTFIAIIVFYVGVEAAESDLVVGEGIIRSEEKVQIKSKLGWPIRRILVQEGNTVRKGDLLIELANDVPRSLVAEIELQLEVAKRELERNLKVPDLLTEKELELSRDAVRRGQTQLATAQATLEETLIRAPFDGMVSRLYLRTGDTPQAAETVLLDFLSLDKLYVEVALPLPYLPHVRKGMAARLDIEGEHASIKTSLTGNVQFVYPEVDFTTRMFRAKVAVPRKGALVLPGMFVRVHVNRPQEKR